MERSVAILLVFCLIVLGEARGTYVCSWLHHRIKAARSQRTICWSHICCQFLSYSQSFPGVRKTTYFLNWVKQRKLVLSHLLTSGFVTSFYKIKTPRSVSCPEQVDCFTIVLAHLRILYAYSEHSDLDNTLSQKLFWGCADVTNPFECQLIKNI